MMLNQALDYSLTPAFEIFACVGTLSCVYLMKLTDYEAEDHSDPHWIRVSWRVGLAALALCMCWAIIYSSNRYWEPWPPLVAIIAAVDWLIAMRIFAILARVRRTGPYMQSPRQHDLMRSHSDKRSGAR